ncbi:peroxiredoxin family protein [Tundrisphaera sp. TA3]|uniref:peroxiredoxin family protein n=1 Tax=Tundrisphaera sp. TA3 TaxID=3435775 RepID=UPI003EBB4DD4
MISATRGLSALLGLLVIASFAGGTASAAAPKVGDKAPDFTLQGSDGKTYTLADFKGKQAVVINWFPKAFTNGCTAQCKSLKANSDKLKPLGVAYFTASVDQPEENAKFAKSLDLDYPILSDPDKATATAYGVLGPRNVAQRWTFYIDKDGVIKAIDKQIKTVNAGEDVAAKVKELGLAG